MEDTFGADAPQQRRKRPRPVTVGAPKHRPRTAPFPPGFSFDAPKMSVRFPRFAENLALQESRGARVERRRRCVW